MIGIVILVFGIIAIIFLVNRYQNRYQSFQGTVFNTIIVILLIFFLFTATYVYTNTDSNITSFEGLIDFVKVYFSWTGYFVRNIGHVVGNVVGQDWGANLTKPA
jgi:hypothetical protein